MLERRESCPPPAKVLVRRAKCKSLVMNDLRSSRSKHFRLEMVEAAGVETKISEFSNLLNLIKCRTIWALRLKPSVMGMQPCVMTVAGGV